MCNRILLFTLLLFGFQSCFFSDDDQPVDLSTLPGSAEAYIEMNYPDAEIEELEADSLCDGSTVYEVEIELKDDEEVELIFDTEGNLLFTVTEVETKDLPSVIVDAVTEQYPDAKIEEAEEMVRPDGTVEYEVEIQSNGAYLALSVNSSGDILCESLDDDD